MNVLTLLKNGIMQCNIISITVTVIVFDLFYSKFSVLCPTPCLGIAAAPAFIKKFQKSHR